MTACRGNDDPSSRGDSASSDAADSASAASDASPDASQEADIPLPADNYVGQSEPSMADDDDHPQVQWKSQLFASADGSDGYQ